MKRIIITEEQYKRNFINEADKGIFNPYELDRMQNYTDRYEYCYEYLGEPIGEGSSRVVFQIDDERVIKLSNNEDLDDIGVEQNKLEWQIIQDKRDVDLFPKGFYASKKYTWIIVEYVIPIYMNGENEDEQEKLFLQGCGVPFNEYLSFINAISTLQKNDEEDDITYDDDYYSYYEDIVNKLAKKYPFLNRISSYMNYYNVNNGDLSRIEHYGLVKRNGKIILVLLDFGLNNDIWEEFYS